MQNDLLENPGALILAKETLLMRTGCHWMFLFMVFCLLLNCMKLYQLHINSVFGKQSAFSTRVRHNCLPPLFISQNLAGARAKPMQGENAEAGYASTCSRYNERIFAAETPTTGIWKFDAASIQIIILTVVIYGQNNLGTWNPVFSCHSHLNFGGNN